MAKASLKSGPSYLVCGHYSKAMRDTCGLPKGHICRHFAHQDYERGDQKPKLADTPKAAPALKNGKLVICNICKAKVKSTRLRKHKIKVHPPENKVKVNSHAGRASAQRKSKGSVAFVRFIQAGLPSLGKHR